MHKAYLSLGSNERPEHYLQLAVNALRDTFGDIILSDWVQTEAVGFDGPDFINGAAVIETDWDVYRLNDWLHALEDAHGRKRDVQRFSNRTLDIDIIFFDDLILQGPGNLQIPRPELKHAFVLGPLAQIAPDYVNPETGISLGALWNLR
ncbi:MAG: 2-amino-4-hydroxy-6-hydroxymethyldihydropteridine diphosphokinase [Arenimonas sp.]|nr:2-amino-4-hydroxy-6-hydroxymethyldihydropteridine diphosphokinase [Arenimonas sp.]MBP7981407.1 2-amino-4-hydroxy-6-hydroxymethyldihydropteridine diphosphokinase [Arenimonas sp.]